MAIKSESLKRLILIVIGGALGNLYDRLKYNGVLDFIDFHVGKLFIFNVADIFITLGIVIMILIEFNGKKKL